MKRRGFTYYDVIAVLLILVLGGALAWALAPSLLGRTPPSCRGRLKRVGVALHMYVQDYDGILPPSSLSEGSRLRQLLRPYDTSLLWRCPIDRRDRQSKRDDQGTSYGYNWLALSAKGRGLSLGRVAHPGKTVAFIESTSDRAAPSALAASGLGTPPDYRNEGWLNVLFLDGRVSDQDPVAVEATATREGKKRLSGGIHAYTLWNLE